MATSPDVTLEREIARVWAVADKDGSGFVDAPEVGALMAQLRQAPVGAAEIAETMAALDANGDGRVSYDEFHSRMRSWLGVSAAPTIGPDASGAAARVAAGLSESGGAEGSSTASSRASTHRKIASFFSAFNRHDSLPASLLASIHASLRDAQENDTSASADGVIFGKAGLFARLYPPAAAPDAAALAQARMDALTACEAHLKALPGYVSTLSMPGSVAAWTGAVTGIVTMLRAAESMDAHTQRPAVRNMLLQAFTSVAHSGVMLHILAFLHPCAPRDAGVPELTCTASTHAETPAHAGMKRSAHDDASSGYSRSRIPPVVGISDAASWTALTLACLAACTFYVRGPNGRGHGWPYGAHAIIRNDGAASGVSWTIALLSSPIPAIRASAAGLLTALASQSVDSHGFVLSAGTADVVVKSRMQAEAGDAFVLATLTPLLAVCCGVTHSTPVVTRDAFLTLLGGADALNVCMWLLTRPDLAAAHVGVDTTAAFIRTCAVACVTRLLPLIDVSSNWGVIGSLLTTVLEAATASTRVLTETDATVPDDVLQTHVTLFECACRFVRTLIITGTGHSIALPDASTSVDAGAYVVAHTGVLTLAAVVLSRAHARAAAAQAVALTLIRTCVKSGHAVACVATQGILTGITLALTRGGDAAAHMGAAAASLVAALCEHAECNDALLRAGLPHAITNVLSGLRHSDDVLADTYADARRSYDFGLIANCVRAQTRMLRSGVAGINARVSAAAGVNVDALAVARVSAHESLASVFALALVTSVQTALTAVYEDKRRTAALHVYEMTPAARARLPALQDAASILSSVFNTEPSAVDPDRRRAEAAIHELLGCLREEHSAIAATDAHAHSSASVLKALTTLGANIVQADHALVLLLSQLLRGAVGASALATIGVRALSSAGSEDAAMADAAPVFAHAALLPAVPLAQAAAGVAVLVVAHIAPGHAAPNAPKQSASFTIYRSTPHADFLYALREQLYAPTAAAAVISESAAGTPFVLSMDDASSYERAHMERAARGDFALRVCVYDPSIGVPQIAVGINSHQARTLGFDVVLAAPSAYTQAFMMPVAAAYAVPPRAQAAAALQAQYGDNIAVSPQVLERVQAAYQAKAAHVGVGLPVELSLPEFEATMIACGMAASPALSALYHALDTDNSGSLSFQEVLVGLTMFTQGSRLDRVHLTFRAFDLDNSGTISAAELHSLVRASTGLDGTAVASIARHLMSRFDADGNGTLDEREFMNAVTTTPELLAVFWG